MLNSKDCCRQSVTGMHFCSIFLLKVGTSKPIIRLQLDEVLTGWIEGLKVVVGENQTL